ncbi:Type II secretory pathway, ATPase PulE/Tfp pilus assembly pathway, ATPase PilB [Methylacidimicrobium sp. AP8]|uniref:GspE/PulE family protein n=1 Tax=Methylacidimicrobium sp. AP8 TaxID=2730359 RepID=UPI0018BFD88B|nr:GspE/PulE family protein [Methylacidimicrobium sp. AP8]CAB4243570.1 Type II secretory pathway, ATPase PulE/Tfp pilus assembly pathway, ATPase PilB [Methylacidimicrobium sp. AP8]
MTGPPPCPSPFRLSRNPHPAVQRLESFLIRSRLVLVDTLKAWHAEATDFDLEEALVRHSRSLPWERWAEACAGQPGWPPLYPADAGHPLPEAAFSETGRRLRRESHGILLSQEPAWCIGILNPFRLEEVESFVAGHLADKPRCFFLLAPGDYGTLALRIEQDAAGFPDWEEEDREEWASRLGLDPALYPSVSALVGEILFGRDPHPVIPLGAVAQAGPIPGCEKALLWRRSQTHAWVLTPDAFCPSLIDSLIETLRAKIHPVACGPKHFARLRSPIERPKEPPGLLSADPLHVRSWPPTELLNLNRSGIVLFDAIVSSALDMGASDISLEPKEKQVRVRFRVDGDYYEQAPLTRSQYAALLDRVKLYGNMAADAKGIFQDGSGTHLHRGIRYDQRYSIVIAKGMEEVTAVRLLSSRVPSLADLRLPPLEHQTLLWFLKQGEGMFISTGPTGSGKTTTLYAMLRAISTPRRKLMTVEDPVEKHFPDAVQIEVREEAGITFASALRGIVRQDPDVLMVGEIRDRESAQIAIDAALTGHQVFTSIHANDAVGVVERMVQSFGIDRLAIAYALRLAVAQRLVSKLCPFCRQTRPAEPEEIAPFPEVAIPEPVVAEAPGCPVCRGTGTAGRMPVMELLPVDGEILAMFEAGATPNEIRRHNEGRGFKPLSRQAAELFMTGTITREEAMLLLSSRTLSK